MQYDDFIKKAMSGSGKKKDYQILVNQITDTQLVFFLREQYPEVWEEFKQWRAYIVDKGAHSSEPIEAEIVNEG